MGTLQQLHSEDRPCSEKNICQLYGKMNFKIVLAFAIVVGVLVDCRSLERPNEDAVDHVIAKFTEMREAFQELAGSKEVTEDKVKQAIKQLENVTGIKLREAFQELRKEVSIDKVKQAIEQLENVTGIKLREEVSNEEVKQAIEQLETVDGFETVNETEQPREAEGGKRQDGGGINCYFG